ncbi:MAG: ArsR family transcriptional regulator [Candidatus Helarchaeota archaeon]
MNKLAENHNDLGTTSQYWWLFGRSGGITRIKIVNLLLERPYNTNQLSTKLKMSYRNIKHHLKLLEQANIVFVNHIKYGKLFILRPDFDIKLFNEIINNSYLDLEEVVAKK